MRRAVSDGSPLGNQAGGVLIADLASGNRIGGTAPGAGNTIAGNLASGVTLEGGAASNTIQGNRIGINVTGTTPQGNFQNGVSLLANAQRNLIGGTDPAARNLIGGNDENGIELSTGATANQIEGNSIGTDSDGLLDVANALNGVVLNDVSVQPARWHRPPAAGNIIFTGNEAPTVS